MLDFVHQLIQSWSCFETYVLFIGSWSAFRWDT